MNKIQLNYGKIQDSKHLKESSNRKTNEIILYIKFQYTAKISRINF